MRARPLVLAGAIFLLVPASAEAHLVTTGLGPVYDGVSHLFLTLDDLLPVIALALLAGLNGSAAGRRALFGLPAAWLAAGLGGFASGTSLLPETAATASLLVLGILTAADRRISPTVVLALATLLGLLHGWQNGASIAQAGREASGLLGIVSAIFVLAALMSAAVVSLRRPWARVAVRVAGSWIAAIGLLRLGWTLSGRG